MISIIKILLTITVALACTNSHAQKQLVLLKGQKVMLQLNPGDDIVFRVKGESAIRKSYINNLSDSVLFTHSDAIPLHHIDRIYFKHSNFLNVVGSVLVIGGTGYFLIDQVNNVIVNGNTARLDKDVARSSAIMAGIGLPLMLIRKKYERPGHNRRILRVVTVGSAFYN